MVKMTREGKEWLDETFGAKGITELHIKAEGGKCPQNCPACRCCKGQIQVVDEPAQPNDTTISAEGYTFSVDADMMKKARLLILDRAMGVGFLNCAKPIW